MQVKTWSQSHFTKKFKIFCQVFCAVSRNTLKKYFGKVVQRGHVVKITEIEITVQYATVIYF